MNQQTTTIQQLYPNLSLEDLKTAEDNLTCYLALVLRIYTRLEQQGMLDVLTDSETLPSMQAKVDSKQP